MAILGTQIQNKNIFENEIKTHQKLNFVSFTFLFN